MTSNPGSASQCPPAQTLSLLDKKDLLLHRRDSLLVNRKIHRCCNLYIIPFESLALYSSDIANWHSCRAGGPLVSCGLPTLQPEQLWYKYLDKKSFLESDCSYSAVCDRGVIWNMWHMQFIPRWILTNETLETVSHAIYTWSYFSSALSVWVCRWLFSKPLPLSVWWSTSITPGTYYWIELWWLHGWWWFIVEVRILIHQFCLCWS